MMSYFVPDFDVDGDEPVASSASPLLHSSHKILQSHEDDELLELLWDHGPVARPLDSREPIGSSDVGSSAEARQLFAGEDEMATWLHHYQTGANDSHSGGSGSGDLYGGMLDPALSSRATVTTAAIVRQGSSSVEAVDVGKVFDAGSVRASVACSAHVSERKRKARPGKDPECYGEDVEVEYGNKRKDVRQSASTRTRVANVHNQSERRRRDRINAKMKALQELIPRCTKSNKASMLDDAIEYLKSLQLQVQMMSSLQYNLGQMMIPDTQRYLHPMGFMGMGMGMVSGGVQRPVMPLGPLLPYPPIVGTSPAILQPQLMPSFHPSNAVIPDQVRIKASNQQDPASNSINMMRPSMVQIPNFGDPYHHYASFHHLHVPYQGQTMAESGTTKELDNTKESTDG